MSEFGLSDTPSYDIPLSGTVTIVFLKKFFIGGGQVEKL